MSGPPAGPLMSGPPAGPQEQDMTSMIDITRRHDEAALEGVAAQARGRFGLALDLFEESLRHAEELGERRKIHAARLNISSCFLSLGDWAGARSGLAAIILES